MLVKTEEKGGYHESGKKVMGIYHIMGTQTQCGKDEIILEMDSVTK